MRPARNPPLRLEAHDPALGAPRRELRAHASCGCKRRCRGVASLRRVVRLGCRCRRLEERRLPRRQLSGQPEGPTRSGLRRSRSPQSDHRGPAGDRDGDAGRRQSAPRHAARQGVRPRRLLVRRLQVEDFLYDACRLRMIGSGTNARASNVPARFAVPMPGLYGVKSASHFKRPPPVGVVKMPLTVNVASSSCAPCAAREGSPTGTSGGGRQMLSL